MKKYTIIFSALMIIWSCGQKDPRAKLKALENQRIELDRQIEQLRAELNKDSTNTTGKISYVSLKQVQATEFKHFIKVQGTITSDNNILIPAQSSGLVKKIYVHEGEKVKKDQVLAELDGAILERTIAEVKTNLELATTIFERQDRLWKKKIGSEVQYLQAKSNKEALQDRLASLQEQYRLTKVISPMNGTVDQILLKEGEATAAGFGAVRVVKSGDLKIETYLSEKYINQIHLGDSVRVEIPIINKTFTSRIKSVSQVIDSKNRTFPVEISVPAMDQSLKPNMLTVLTINDYTNAQAIVVPVNVVQNTGEVKFLFTAVQHKTGDLWRIEKKNVITGLDYDNQVEILDGLSQGERIVTVGYQNLAAGQQVKQSENNGIAEK